MIQEPLSRRIIRTSVAALLTLAVFAAGWGTGFILGYESGRVEANREWLILLYRTLGDKQNDLRKMPEGALEGGSERTVSGMAEGIQQASTTP